MGYSLVAEASKKPKIRLEILVLAAVLVGGPAGGFVVGQCWIAATGGTACDQSPSATTCGSGSSTWNCQWVQIGNGTCNQAQDSPAGATTNQVTNPQCKWQVRTCGGSHGTCIDAGYEYTYTAECHTASGGSCPPSGGGGGDEHMLPEDP